MLTKEESLGYFTIDEFWHYCGNLITSGMTKRDVSRMLDIPKETLYYNLTRLGLHVSNAEKGLNG
jgi:hypothetical protein